jgi:hypothetical protein
MRPVRLAIGLGLVVTLGGLLIALSLKAPRLSGTNTLTDLSTAATTVPPGRQVCQRGESVPSGTGGIRIFTTPPPAAPEVPVVLRRAGEVIARGSFTPVHGGNVVRLSPHVERPLRHVQVCLRNRGPGELNLGDNGDTHAPLPTFDGRAPRPTERIRFDYMRPGSESWWQIAGTVATRFGLEKGGLSGSALIWIVFTFVLLIDGAVVLWMWRRLPA